MSSGSDSIPLKKKCFDFIRAMIVREKLKSFKISSEQRNTPKYRFLLKFQRSNETYQNVEYF